LHPDVVRKTSPDDIESLIKAVGYFRNFSIFKKLYTLAYKSKSLTLENFKEIKDEIIQYKDTHANDYFLDGFVMCMRKSKRVDETKLIETFIIPFVDNKMVKSRSKVFKNQLHKSLTDYYDTSRPINLAIFTGTKFVKINNDNIVKLITKFL
jgi:hypothetical protein